MDYFNAWTNALNFKGRARRREYWAFGLGNVAILFAIALAGLTAAGPNPSSQAMLPLIITMQVFVLATILPQLSLTVRRCHDIGRPGTFTLTNLIPILNIYTGLILAFKPSEPTTNHFGPSPKRSAQLEPIAPSSLSATFGPAIPHHAAPEPPNPFLNPATDSGPTAPRHQLDAA